jgi:folate-binding protein YgfZ
VATRVEKNQEYGAATEGCALLDRSERGKLALTGSEAKEFLNGQLTNEIVELSPGQGCYAAFLTPKGKMRGDLRVLDIGDEIFLDCERSTLQDLFDMIRHYKLGMDVELHKRTLERSLLSLIGPASETVVPGGADRLGSEEHDNTKAEIAGQSVYLVRTDLGIDLIFDSAFNGEIEAHLLAAGAIQISEATAEIVRVESGRPRYGVDLDETVIPQEAGLNDRAVSFTKGCYTGQETVARLFYRGKPNRHLRGIKLAEPSTLGEPLFLGEKQVGKLGSIVESPTFGPIALALVRREAAAGDLLKVGNPESEPSAQVVDLPF